MGFKVIPGAFRVAGVNKAGRAYGFEPDGDSVRFVPDDPSLVTSLPQPGRKVEFNAIGSCQLRLEGVDALELHFDPEGRAVGETHQPRPAADQARDFLTGFLGLDPVSYRPPKNITVDPPVPNDGQRGYILSRSLEVHGRPVAFVYAGQPPVPAGQEFFLSPAHLTGSLNHALLRSGMAYPLYYDTLFADLRNTFTKAVRQARRKRRGASAGVWANDLTTSPTGLTVNHLADLEGNGFIFPKLFRRLAEWLATGAPNAAEFLTFPKLATEQVLILDRSSPEFTNMTHLDNIIEVAGTAVRMRIAPEHLVFISEK